MKYAPWTLWWVRFDPQVGHEQAGRRPAIVVGSGLAGKVAIRSGLVIVVPCSTRDRGMVWQPPVLLDGVTDGVAMCDQVKAISVERIDGPYAGTVAPTERSRIRAALASLLVV